MAGILIVIIIIFLIIIIASASGGSTKATSQTVDPSSIKSFNTAERSVATEVSKPANLAKSTTKSTQQPTSKPVAARQISPSTSSARTPPPPAKVAATPIPRKPDWQDFQRLLTKRNIQTLYHFTDRRNLPSIRQHGGLYSWSYCEQHHIAIPFPASNDLSKALDVRKGLQDFVRLSFNPCQPMMYVAQGRGVVPVVLEISPEVIFWLHTQFSNVNATANNASIGSSIQDFKNINFPLALSGNWTTAEEKAFIQAEVLVKTKLPIQFIRNI
jgi:hypothetical protein